MSESPIGKTTAPTGIEWLIPDVVASVIIFVGMLGVVDEIVVINDVVDTGISNEESIVCM